MHIHLDDTSKPNCSMGTKSFYVQATTEVLAYNQLSREGLVI